MHKKRRKLHFFCLNYTSFYTQCGFGSGFCVLRLHFFFFFFSFFFPLLLHTRLGEQMTTVHEQQPYIVDFSTPFISPVYLVNSAQDPQTSLFSNFFIKNGSHNTIHTFKNYFTTVFSVFNFNKLNKFYLNGPLPS